MRLRAVLLASPILGALACYVPGEIGELGFELNLADRLYEFRSGDRVLVGATICPHVMMGHRADGSEVLFPGDYETTSLLPCMDEMISGPAQFNSNRCWSLDTPGEITWTLSPNGMCEYDGDSIRLLVVEPSDSLRLGFDDWRVRITNTFWVDGDLFSVVGLAPGRTLDDLREDPSAPRLVVNGQLDAPMLRLDDDLGRVWFDDLELEIVGEGAIAVEPEMAPDPYVSTEFRLAGERPLTLSPAATVRIRATLPNGQTLESPELIAVPPSAAASLDLMVASAADGPMYAFAEVRDAEGRVLHGAPVEWGVSEGALAVVPGDMDSDARTGEYAEIYTDCEPPPTEPTERRATLVASIGELQDSVELTWIASPPEEPSALPFEPSESCMFGDDEGEGEGEGDTETGGDDAPIISDSGCACNSSSQNPAAGGLLLLSLLALPCRRRQP